MTEEGGSSSWFSSICSCCRKEQKEPPVQLIRSASIKQLAITAGEETSPEHVTHINDVNDRKITAPIATTTTVVNDNTLNMDEAINMNDVFMSELLAEGDEVSAVVEEDVSISADVVEAVDDEHLHIVIDSKSPKPDSSAASSQRDATSYDIAQAPTARIGDTSGGEEQHDQTRSLSEVNAADSEASESEEDEEVMMEQAAQKVARTEAPLSPREVSDVDDDDDFDPDALRAKQPQTKEAADWHEQLHKEAASQQKAEDNPNWHEELHQDAAHRQQTVENQQNWHEQQHLDAAQEQRMASVMYMDASSDEESEEEEGADSEEEEAVVEVNEAVKLPTVVRTTAEVQSASSSSAGSVSSTSSVAEREHENFESSTESEEEIESEKENALVTRISLKSNGRATVISPGAVRIQLNDHHHRDEETDEEFSEKLV